MGQTWTIPSGTCLIEQIFKYSDQQDPLLGFRFQGPNKADDRPEDLNAGTQHDKSWTLEGAHDQQNDSMHGQDMYCPQG